MTALFVSNPSRPWQRRLRRAWSIGSDRDAVLREIVTLGDRLGVPVRTAHYHDPDPAEAILRQLNAGKHNLVVMGVSARPGDTLDFGAVPGAVLDRSERSLLFVAS